MKLKIQKQEEPRDYLEELKQQQEETAKKILALEKNREEQRKKEEERKIAEQQIQQPQPIQMPIAPQPLVQQPTQQVSGCSFTKLWKFMVIAALVISLGTIGFLILAISSAPA